MALTFEPMTDGPGFNVSILMEKLNPVRIRPPGMVDVYGVHKVGQDILELEVREDDVWVVTFPKCGTTWAQEMVWLLGNNFDFKKAKEVDLPDRFTFVEMMEVSDPKIKITEYMKAIGSPRFIKSHLHKELLPLQLWTKKPKIVYVFRNPKDAAISYFHHSKLLDNYVGSQELFLEAYVQDEGPYAPFWEHVLEFWKMRHQPNILFLTYEDMKRDLPAVVRKTADFLQVKYTKEEEAALLDHLSFESMRTNTAVNYENQFEILKSKGEGTHFLRQGQAGGWKKAMSVEMVELFNKWTETKLKGTDFPREEL